MYRNNPKFGHGHEDGNLEDAKVDVVECSDMGCTDRWSDPQDPDATEYSSSFSSTVSDSEYCLGLSDDEVESEYLPSAFNRMRCLRKKKLTNHWRNFIRPLMWRCKWTELRIKEIKSGALSYADALSAYEQESHLGLAFAAVEELSSKSLPFYQQSSSRKIMRRKKRKKAEEITDLSSYMSHHNLFSHFENKKFDTEANTMAGDVFHSDKAGTAADEFGATSDHLYKSHQIDLDLEHVLQKIEVVYSRVNKLRNQLDLIMSQNTLKFSSSENLSILLGAFDDAPSPTFSAGNGDSQLIGHEQHNPNYDLDSLILPKSAVSSFNEVVSVPDVIESTSGLLSSADVTLHRPILDDTTGDIVDNILIHNELAEVEAGCILKYSISEPTVNQLESGRGEQDESPDPSPQDVPSHQHSSIQSGLASNINVPMNKRKRGERKSGSGSWNK